MNEHAEQTIRFSEQLLDEFRTNVGCFRPETGGMIGCSRDPAVIDLYAFDKGSKNTSISFDYDEIHMTKVYQAWKETGGIAAGFIHSHPSGFMRPSYDDISMSLPLMRFFKNDFFYMPIVQAQKDGLYTLYFYLLRMNEQEITETLEYVIEATPDGYKTIPQGKLIQRYPIKQLERHYGPDKVAAARKNRPQAVNPAAECQPAPDVPKYSPKEIFTRLENMYPDHVLDKTIILVGCGGGRTIAENLTRNGFRNFVLIDGDTIAPSNIATQGVFLSEMGQKKVFALRDRMLDINSEIHVTCVDRFLDDSISDEQFSAYLKDFSRKKPTDFLILGCTDDFRAQHRISMLALKYSIPYIGASMYAQGLAAETIFLYPGLTKSCPRCLLRPRYEAYESGYQNTVTSAGCPTFATERLNTLIGFLSLMILMYHDAPGSPYNTMLEGIADRNFACIRLSPGLGDSPLGIRLFDKAFRDDEAQKFTFMDETIWIPQHPDSPEHGESPCKICGGTGDLTALHGRWPDTRLLKING